MSISKYDFTIKYKGLAGCVSKVAYMNSEPTVQRILVKRLNDIILR